MTYHFLPANFLPRRALAFSGVAAFHVLVAYLLLTALVQPAAPVPTTHTVGIFTPETHVERQRLPLLALPPSEQHPVIEVPTTPEVASPPDRPALSAVGVTGPRSTGGSAVVSAAPPVRLLGVNQLPNTEEYYPPGMIREGVQGATNVRACVDPQGRLLGSPAIEETSGHGPLDSAALNLVRHGRFARSMQGDVAVGNCFRFRIDFKIQK